MHQREQFRSISLSPLYLHLTAVDSILYPYPPHSTYEMATALSLLTVVA